MDEKPKEEKPSDPYEAYKRLIKPIQKKEAEKPKA